MIIDKSGYRKLALFLRADGEGKAHTSDNACSRSLTRSSGVMKTKAAQKRTGGSEMIRKNRALVVACVAFVTLRVAAQVPLPAEVVAANRALDDRLIAAHAAKDTNAVLALFSTRPDIFFIAPNGEINKGREQIRSSYDSFFAQLDSITAEMKDVSYLQQGDGVIAVGTVVFHRHPKRGDVNDRTVVWTDFRRVENGKWVYVFRHAHWPVNQR